MPSLRSLVLPPEVSVKDLLKGFAFTPADPGDDPETVFSIGYGRGRWRSFRLAARLPELERVSVFYGATSLRRIKLKLASP